MPSPFSAISVLKPLPFRWEGKGFNKEDTEKVGENLRVWGVVLRIGMELFVWFRVEIDVAAR